MQELVAKMKKKLMVNDSEFRKSAKCVYFSNILLSKTVDIFPICKLKGKELSKEWIETNGLVEPILIEEHASSLGMKVPDSSVTISDVANTIGVEFPLKIIGVGEQNEILGWSIGDYAHYLTNRTADHKVLNLISLEISPTPLSSKIQSPSLVRDIDWIDKCWPLEVFN